MKNKIKYKQKQDKNRFLFFIFLFKLTCLFLFFSPINAQTTNELVWDEETESYQQQEQKNDNEAQEKYLATPIEKKKFDRSKWNNLKRKTVEKALGESDKYEKGASPYEGETLTENDNPYQQSQEDYGNYWEEKNKNEKETKYRPPEKTPEKNYNSPISKAFGVQISPTLSYILLGIIIAILTGIIFYLFFRTSTDKSNKKVVPNFDEVPPTEIPKSELELMLEKALTEKDYRKAIRIYFIFIIRGLSKRNWIKWEKEKTNFSYLNEMRKNKLYHSFDESVTLYEIVWYGKRIIDRNTYNQLEPTFKNLIKKIDE